MRSAYRVLAYLVAVGVVVQGGAIAYAYFGLSKWIEEGGVLDQATIESGSDGFPEIVGFIVHGLGGQFLIPLLALALLVVAFFAKVPNGVRWAAAVFGLVIMQVLLGIFGSGVTGLGLLHGLNALVLFAVAFLAARRSTVPAEDVRERVGMA